VPRIELFAKAAAEHEPNDGPPSIDRLDVNVDPSWKTVRFRVQTLDGNATGIAEYFGDAQSIGTR
jgi:hypothetical protein